MGALTARAEGGSKERLMRLFSVLFALLCLAVGSQANAEGDDYKAPRGPGGVHPDLNGIWQALGSAHYDIEMHTASHSMQLREGPHGAHE